MKRRRDLNTHEVVRVVQPTFAFPITRIGPVWSNNREQRAALGDLLVHHFGKVRAKRDRINVHEQEIVPQFAL